MLIGREIGNRLRSGLVCGNGNVDVDVDILMLFFFFFLITFAMKPLNALKSTMVRTVRRHPNIPVGRHSSTRFIWIESSYILCH